MEGKELFHQWQTCVKNNDLPGAQEALTALDRVTESKPMQRDRYYTPAVFQHDAFLRFRRLLERGDSRAAKGQLQYMSADIHIVLQQLMTPAKPQPTIQSRLAPPPQSAVVRAAVVSVVHPSNGTPKHPSTNVRNLQHGESEQWKLARGALQKFHETLTEKKWHAGKTSRKQFFEMVLEGGISGVHQNDVMSLWESKALTAAMVDAMAQMVSTLNKELASVAEWRPKIVLTGDGRYKILLTRPGDSAGKGVSNEEAAARHIMEKLSRCELLMFHALYRDCEPITSYEKLSCAFWGHCEHNAELRKRLGQAARNLGRKLQAFEFGTVFSMTHHAGQGYALSSSAKVKR